MQRIKGIGDIAKGAGNRLNDVYIRGKGSVGVYDVNYRLEKLTITLYLSFWGLGDRFGFGGQEGKSFSYYLDCISVIPKEH